MAIIIHFAQCKFLNLYLSKTASVSASVPIHNNNTSGRASYLLMCLSVCDGSDLAGLHSYSVFVASDSALVVSSDWPK